MDLGSDRYAIGCALLRAASSELRGLHRVRGAYRRTTRRIARAVAAVMVAEALLGIAPRRADAQTMPTFVLPAVEDAFNLQDVGYNATPVFADIDGDGDFDAFVGDFRGNTNFFRNTGGTAAPAFAPPVVNPFGFVDLGMYSPVAFVDIDGDGDLDVFQGENFGDTFYLENTGTAAAPAFAAPVENPFGLSDVGERSAPFFVDVDGDDDFDAFIGNRYGQFTFFANTGAASAPAFAMAISNPFGLGDEGSYAMPAFVDIDGDGDLDAFAGRLSGLISFYENTAAANAPAPAFLEQPDNPFGLPPVDRNAAPAFVDIDGDQDLDAFVGNRDGGTAFVENTGSPTAPSFRERVNPFGVTRVAEGFSHPAFADVDGDQDLDLFVGDDLGNLSFFSNTGTRDAPAFDDPSSNPFGIEPVAYFAAPASADIDGDGDLDLFVGGFDGYISFFENTGNANMPAFAEPVVNPFGSYDGNPGAAPAFGDIDGDDDLDLLIGSSGTYLVFLENTGDSTTPAFAEPVPSPFGLGAVGRYSFPTFVDIDGDGDLDLFVGSGYGDWAFFQNTGGPSSPAFAESAFDPFGLQNVARYSAPQFPDIDGDGDFDAFTGSSAGDLFFFRNVDPGTERTPTPASTPTSTPISTPTPTPTFPIIVPPPMTPTPSPTPTATPSPPATCFGIPATIAGTPGDDVLDGTPGDDVIQGLEGNDLIRGFGGNDFLCGGNGDDEIRGGRGTDLIRGGMGNDLVRGGPDDDFLAAGRGSDVTNGGTGNDVCLPDPEDASLVNCEG